MQGIGCYTFVGLYAWQDLISHLIFIQRLRISSKYFN